MADLWVGNVEEDASEDEFKEFLIKYGFPPFDEIKRVPGTGSRPAGVLTFNSVIADALRSLQPRIHNMFWKSRALTVQVMPERDES